MGDIGEINMSFNLYNDERWLNEEQPTIELGSRAGLQHSIADIRTSIS